MLGVTGVEHLQDLGLASATELIVSEVDPLQPTAESLASLRESRCADITNFIGPQRETSQNWIRGEARGQRYGTGIADTSGLVRRPEVHLRSDAILIEIECSERAIDG